MTVFKNFTPVLILVLLEYTLGVSVIDHKASFDGLNPCFVGIYSRREGLRDTK